MKKALIVEKYHELHFDDFPILFFGKNEENCYLLGSFIHEDDEIENTLKFFHVLVGNVVFLDFLHKKISYLELLKKAQNIFYVHKDYRGNVQNIAEVKYDEIPVDILPLDWAFCPEIEKSLLLLIEKEIKPIFLQKSNKIFANSSVYKNTQKNTFHLKNQHKNVRYAY